MAGGRPTKFNQKVADEICDRLANGEGLKSICRDDKMPGYSTIFRWLGDNPQFQEQYAYAREIQGDSDADEIHDLTQRVISGELEPQAARVAIDALKWSAGKRRPKKYGEKLDLNHSGEVNITGIEMSFVRPDTAS